MIIYSVTAAFQGNAVGQTILGEFSVISSLICIFISGWIHGDPTTFWKKFFWAMPQCGNDGSSMKNNFARKKFASFTWNSGEPGRSLGTSKTDFSLFLLSLEPIFWPLVEGDWTRITSKGFLFPMYYDQDIAFLMCTTFLDSPKIHVARVHRKCNISVIVHRKKKSFGGYSSSVSLHQ